MDWDNLRYFLELARTGTLAGVAPVRRSLWRLSARTCATTPSSAMWAICCLPRNCSFWMRCSNPNAASITA